MKKRKTITRKLKIDLRRKTSGNDGKGMSGA